MESELDKFKSPYSLPPIEQPQKKKKKKNQVDNEPNDRNISPAEQEEDKHEQNSNNQDFLPAIPIPVSFKDLPKIT